MTLHAHSLIAQTAREMAEALWEETAQDNATMASMKVLEPKLTQKQLRQKFINSAASRLLPQARATLAKMLEGNINEQLKEQIKDALIKDAALIRGRDKAISGLH